jgi:hypothetical protein
MVLVTLQVQTQVKEMMVVLQVLDIQHILEVAVVV